MNPKSLKESSSLPKIMEEFEDQHINNRILKEAKTGGGGGGGGNNTSKVSTLESVY